mgnify:CR=1 FL=1
MKLRIYLADLTHTGVGIATEAFPLNIGLIASYCLKEFGGMSLLRIVLGQAKKSERIYGLVGETIRF